MDNELERIFASNQLRLTGPRREVFTILKANDDPMAASDIATRCKEADRTSVYRTLELFTELGITHIVPFGWKQRYELASPFKSHHHHLSCIQCGKLIDIHSPQLERAMAKVASDNGFSETEHTFEIRGRCSNCR